MRRRHRSWSVAFALLVGSAQISQAQSFNASVVGTVMDASGGVLPGATVAIREINTGQLRETVSGTTGAFSRRTSFSTAW